MDEFTKDLAINTNKDKIVELLCSTGIVGMDNLVDYMGKHGFFTSPCSTSSNKHLACEGGLAEHSLNVYEFAQDTYLTNKQIHAGTVNLNSIKIVSLLHDLGKMGNHGKPGYVPNMIQDKKNKGQLIQSDSKPYEINKNLPYIPHEIISISLAKQFIELTEEEEFAIIYHNGLYTGLGRDLNGKERPLQMLLHFADMWCSRVIEKDGEE